VRRVLAADRIATPVLARRPATSRNPDAIVPHLPPCSADRDSKRHHSDHTDIDEQCEKRRTVRPEEAGARIDKPEHEDDDQHARAPSEEPLGRLGRPSP